VKTLTAFRRTKDSGMMSELSSRTCVAYPVSIEAQSDREGSVSIEHGGSFAAAIALVPAQLLQNGRSWLTQSRMRGHRPCWK
jgi:hypothetical protein